jgi:phage tail protein X
MDQIVAQQGDSVDLVAHRIYGTTDMVPEILAANPGLAAFGPILPLGTPILLPPAKVQTVAAPITLW